MEEQAEPQPQQQPAVQIMQSVTITPMPEFSLYNRKWNNRFKVKTCTLVISRWTERSQDF